MPPAVNNGVPIFQSMGQKAVVAVILFGFGKIAELYLRRLALVGGQLFKRQVGYICPLAMPNSVIP